MMFIDEDEREIYMEILNFNFSLPKYCIPNTAYRSNWPPKSRRPTCVHFVGVRTIQTFRWTHGVSICGCNHYPTRIRIWPEHCITIGSNCDTNTWNWHPKQYHCYSHCVNPICWPSSRMDHRMHNGRKLIV